MKSYLQGLITGGVLVFAMFVLMGQQTQKAYATTQKESLVSLQRATEINKLLRVMGLEPNNDHGRYQIAISNREKILIDTRDGEPFIWNDGTKSWELMLSYK